VNSINEYLLPLRSAAFSRRNPTDCSNVPKSEMRKEWIVFPSVQLKTILQFIANQLVTLKNTKLMSYQDTILIKSTPELQH
jgi:hypothetical protein